MNVYLKKGHELVSATSAVTVYVEEEPGMYSICVQEDIPLHLVVLHERSAKT